MSAFVSNISFRRLFKTLALLVIAILLILSGCLISLPLILNSSKVQESIKKTLSTALKREISWSKLTLDRQTGLTISALKFDNGPAPLLNAAIEQISISPSLVRNSEDRLSVKLSVNVNNTAFALAPSLIKPPPVVSKKDPLTQFAETVQNIQKLDFPLPVDVSVVVDVASLQARYAVPQTGKEFLLQDFAFRFDMQSLALKPVTTDVSGMVSVNGKKVGKIGLKAKINDLVTKERRIRLASALFALDAVAPGTIFTVSGGLNQANGLVALSKFNLHDLSIMAQPFLSPKVPDLTGNINLQLQAKADPQKDLQGGITFAATGLSAIGGSLATKKVGPFDVTLQQRIITDHVRQRVNLSEGRLSSPGLIEASWHALINRPSFPERTLDMDLSSVKIDIAKALLLAEPFIPQAAPYKKKVGELYVRDASIKLDGADNGKLSIGGVGVKLPQLDLLLSKGKLNADSVDIVLEKIECPLLAKKPTGLTGELIWSIKRAVLSGAEPVSLVGARGNLGLTVNNLNLKSPSPRKISADVTVTQSMDFATCVVGKQLQMKNIHEQLRLKSRATNTGTIEASLDEFAVKISSIQRIDRKSVSLPVVLSLAASGLKIPAVKGVLPTMQHAVANVSAGDFLQLAAEASLLGDVTQKVTTKGAVQLDLQRLLPYAAQFVTPGLKADGIAKANWNITAPLLTKKSDDPLKNPLRSARSALSRFDKLDITVKLDKISAHIPAAKGSFKVADLHTKPDLNVTSNGNGELLTFAGGLFFSGLSGTSASAAKMQQQHGSFTFNGELSGWREFHLTEALRCEPLGISHNAKFDVSRIDALFEEKQPFSLATLVKRLDVTLSADFNGLFPHTEKQLLAGLEVAGSVSSSARIDLTAGRDIAFRYALKTNDFDLQLANGTRIEGLRSDIGLNRSYSLVAMTRNESWTPLSNALVKPAAKLEVSSGAVEIARRVHDDLRGDVSGFRSFSIKRLTTKSSSRAPLVLTALEGDLLFTKEQVGVSYFQGDLLGGTMLARGVFDLRPEMPVISAGSSFSNLDITRLLPQDRIKMDSLDKDAEITGDVSLMAPLTTDQRELFEQLRLAVNIRKIGANAIERALFTLDPYERNEQITAQRKMLKLGSLRGLRANAVDGAFSMEGEAQIKGVAVELPRVERLRISELPIRQELVKKKDGIKSLLALLELMRADTIIVGKKGELSLKRGNYAK